MTQGSDVAAKAERRVAKYRKSESSLVANEPSDVVTAPTDPRAKPGSGGADDGVANVSRRQSRILWLVGIAALAIVVATFFANGAERETAWLYLVSATTILFIPLLERVSRKKYRKKPPGPN